MLPTLVISLREFLEVFLIIGVFLGISKKLNLKREREIILASLLGLLFSLLLPTIVFLLGEKAHQIFTEKSTDLLEGYLMVFSGFFIAYVIFSLHNFFVLKRSKSIISAHQKLQKNMFDLSLFATIVFFIIREGFEIALFTATTSLFSKFIENIAGLFLGFAISAILGAATFLAYIKFSIGKIFKVTEYAIIILGASFVKNGVTILTEYYLHVHLDTLLPLPLTFLPTSETFIGHLLKNLFGLEREFSGAKFAVMMIYISALYFFFLKRKANQT